MTTNKLLIFDAFGEAWRNVKGSKALIWGAYVIYLGLAFTTGFFSGFIGHFLPGFDKPLLLLLLPIMFWFNLGVCLLGIKRITNQASPIETIFTPFCPANILKLIGAFFLELAIFMPTILLLIGPAFFAGPTPKDVSNILKLTTATSYLLGFAYFFYFYIRLKLAPALILDKNLGVVEAIKSSFKATAGNFWRMFAFIFIRQAGFIITFPLMILAQHPVYGKNIPLLIACAVMSIPSIWYLPFYYLSIGSLYKRLALSN